MEVVRRKAQISLEEEKKLQYDIQFYKGCGDEYFDVANDIPLQIPMHAHDMKSIQKNVYIRMRSGNFINARMHHISKHAS